MRKTTPNPPKGAANAKAASAKSGVIKKPGVLETSPTLSEEYMVEVERAILDGSPKKLTGVSIEDVDSTTLRYKRGPAEAKKPAVKFAQFVVFEGCYDPSEEEGFWQHLESVAVWIKEVATWVDTEFINGKIGSEDVITTMCTFFSDAMPSPSRVKGRLRYETEVVQDKYDLLRLKPHVFGAGKDDVATYWNIRRYLEVCLKYGFGLEMQ